MCGLLVVDADSPVRVRAKSAIGEVPVPRIITIAVDDRRVTETNQPIVSIAAFIPNRGAGENPANARDRPEDPSAVCHDASDPSLIKSLHVVNDEMLHRLPGPTFLQQLIGAIGAAPQLDTALCLVLNRICDAVHLGGVTSCGVLPSIDQNTLSRRFGQGRVVVDLCHPILDQTPELGLAETGTAVDHQWNVRKRMVNVGEALKIQLRLSLHASVHGTDGDRQEVHTGLRDIPPGFLDRGIHEFPGMPCCILASTPGT